MILANMQPYFFPYLGYWQLLEAVDTFVVFDNAHFIHGGWINRNRILSNGRPLLLTLPRSSGGSEKTLLDLSVAGGTTARTKLLRSIEQNYARAPYFKLRKPLIEAIVNDDADNLGDFLVNSIRRIAENFGLPAKIVRESQLTPPRPDGMTCQEWIIELCRRFGADTYVNAIGGQEFYDRATFSAAGIELKFIRNQAGAYRQFHHEFVPDLSIIDELVFNSDDTMRQRFKAFELF